MQNNTSDKATQYSSAAAIFANQNLTWEQLLHSVLRVYLISYQNGVSDFRDFESWYVHDRPIVLSGDPWADEEFPKNSGDVLST